MKATSPPPLGDCSGVGRRQGRREEGSREGRSEEGRNGRKRDTHGYDTGCWIPSPTALCTYAESTFMPADYGAAFPNLPPRKSIKPEEGAGERSREREEERTHEGVLTKKGCATQLIVLDAALTSHRFKSVLSKRRKDHMCRPPIPCIIYHPVLAKAKAGKECRATAEALKRPGEHHRAEREQENAGGHHLSSSKRESVGKDDGQPAEREAGNGRGARGDEEERRSNAGACCGGGKTETHGSRRNLKMSGLLALVYHLPPAG
ncbi:hypothetical protein DFH06DRAFT_1137991 [Mycena polygramma]|nr:hypothetical protein DFH06DRAFT_1137991 [Mycena polygramma]